MKKELANFEDWPYKVPSIKGSIRKIGVLRAEFNAAKTPQEAFSAFKKIERFGDKMADDCTHVQVLYSLDTTNKTYEKGMNVLNEGLPLLNAASVEFTKDVLKSPFRSYLEKKLGTFIFTMYEYQLKGFDEKIIPEMTEENKLTMQYGAAIASCKVEFRGKTYNLPQMGKFMQDSDRTTRKEASKAYYSYLMTRKDELEDIFAKLVKIRDAMAKKLGYKSYTDLAYIHMNRFDYTPEMVKGYRDQIAEVVTPLANKLMREQAKRTEIRTPKIYDLPFAFKSGNPIPLGSTEEKVAHAKKMYKELSPDTDYFFNFMADHHLFFLEAKPGKQSGGYMTYFPVHKCPIIFSNFNGTSGDVDVLTHEFGHCFQAYMARNIKVPEYRSPTMESCEIDSMSMEFFAEPWMSLFFDEPDKYRYKHLAESIEFLPYGATVDEFQHWVYAHPEATNAERDEEWAALENKYTPYKAKAKEGCPEAQAVPRWITQGHIFESPFYYIDYTLAQVLAFEFFNLDRKNHERAWKRYLKLCKMGGKYPFITLITKDGLKNPFEPGVLKKTIRPLTKVLAGYHAERF
ncbi:MAG: M3 family oligoendopeptidase [Bacilli bacterium]|jgi:M3 family oligoendopeptidase|nr:M3 family oligoendopeptidase [Bacilli bacterium]